MKYLVITDLHGNLAALEAILSAPEAHGHDAVLSLGDQVNYGPDSDRVLTRLKSLGAILLEGNHEERLKHISGDAFSGANWCAARYTYERVKHIRTELLREYLADGVLCTHAVPGDPYRLVDADGALEELSRLPDSIRLLLTGHNHGRWHARQNGRAVCNPGSAGMWEGGPGAVAPFAMLETSPVHDPRITLHAVSYDIAKVEHAFLESGLPDIDPVMPHIALNVMRTGGDMLLPFIRHAIRVAEARDVPFGDTEAWLAADATWAWTDAQSSTDFWAKLRG